MNTKDEDTIQLSTLHGNTVQIRTVTGTITLVKSNKVVLSIIPVRKYEAIKDTRYDTYI